MSSQHINERKPHCLPIGLLFGILLLPVTSTAEKAPGFIFHQEIGGCLNPLGFLLDSRFLYRVPLSQDTGILFRTAKFEAGVINEWSPGDELLGMGLNIEPIAVFNIWAKAGIYEIHRLFGFGYRRLEGKDGPYHDSDLSEITQENRLGSRITLAPSLKIKLSSFILADNFTVNRIDVFNTDDYFYEIRTALPHASHDFDFINDAVALYEWNKKLLTGLNYNLVYIRGTVTRQQKLGGMVIYNTAYKKLTTVYGLITGGVYLESDLRNHSFYIAALGGFELPLLRGKKTQVRTARSASLQPLTSLLQLP